MDQSIISTKIEIKKGTHFRDAGSFRERLEFMIKWYPQGIHGLELEHLQSLSSQPNGTSLAKPSLVRIKRDCLNDLVKILDKPKKSLQRGLATFFRSAFGLYNVSNYNREWMVFGKKPKEETHKKKKIRKKTSRLVKNKKPTKTQRKPKTKTKLPISWPTIETKQLTKKQIVTNKQQTKRKKPMSNNNENEKIRTSNAKINIGIQQKEKHQQYYQFNNCTRLDNKMINNMKDGEKIIKNGKTIINTSTNTNTDNITNTINNIHIKTHWNDDINFNKQFNNVFENKSQPNNEPNINFRKRLFINVEPSINYHQFQNFEQQNQQKKQNLITQIIKQQKHQQQQSKEKIQQQWQMKEKIQQQEQKQKQEQEQKQNQKQEENLEKFLLSPPTLPSPNNQQSHFQLGNWKDFKNKVNLNSLHLQQKHPVKFEDQFNIQLNKPFENNIQQENGLKDSCEGLFMVRDPFSFVEDSQFVLLQSQPEMDNFLEFL
ncbi:hypothetical protein M0812_03698 [Anaeramoeba flamelloides]|uniref:Uncharacterized protein n=1 Tax=Anaeramoeba flamelloides TaxID=1746091 RepID=A0AAV8AEA0_9EUKA|nr:hypothetical protein M0812_03698 [Anaeramoeba flamelloides]